MAQPSVDRPHPLLRLLLGGDVMLGRQAAVVVAEKDPDYPLAALSELIAGADLFFVNLECAISARPQRFPGAAKAFYFRAGPEAVQVLESAGVDLVSLANNHTLDAGIAIAEEHRAIEIDPAAAGGADVADRGG